MDKLSNSANSSTTKDVNGITITKNNLSRFNKRLHNALKEVSPDISLSESSQIFAKACGKKNSTELKELMEIVAQKDIKKLTFQENAEFFKDVEESGIYKSSINPEYLFNPFFDVLVEKSKNGHSVPDKFKENKNWGFRVCFIELEAKKINNEFFNKNKVIHKFNIEDADYCDLTEWIKAKKLKINYHLNELDSINWNEKIAIIVYDYSPLNIFNGEKLIQRFYSMFFVALNKSNRLDLVFNVFDVQGDCTVRDEYSSGLFVGLPLACSINGLYADIKAMSKLLIEV